MSISANPVPDVDVDVGTTLHSIRSFWTRHSGAWPSEGALRFLIASRRRELCDVGAVLSPPGIDRILIDEARFLAWLRGERAVTTGAELNV